MAERSDEDGIGGRVHCYDNQQGAIVPKVQQVCSNHPKNHLEVFCNTCKVPVCHECALWGKHQGHRFIPWNEPGQITVSRQLCVGEIPDDMTLHSTKEGMLGYLEECAGKVSEAIQVVQRRIDRVHAEWNTIEEEASQVIHDMFDRLGESAAAELQMLEDDKTRLEAQAEEIAAFSEDIKAKTWSLKDGKTQELAQLKHKVNFQIQPTPSTTSTLISEIIPPYTSVTLKIQNFHELQSCNLKVYSRPLRVDGLVWRLRVYPNGYGEGRGKYLSVFAELTSGNGTTINYQYCIEILHSGRSIHYRQYVSDFSDGGSWGYTKFYLLSKLEEEGTIIEDTLVLRFGIRAPSYHLKCSQLVMHNQRLEGTLKSLKRKLRTMQQSLIMHKTEGLLEEDKCPTITCNKPMPRQTTTTSLHSPSPIPPQQHTTTTSLHSPSPTLPQTIVRGQVTCSANGSSEVPRPKQAQNQVEIMVTTNKAEAPSNQGNKVLLQLHLSLDPEMGVTLVKPEEQEGVETAVTRDWTPMSSTACFSWPASRSHSLERPRPLQSMERPHPLLCSSLERSCSMPTSSTRPHIRAEETIVEIPDCFDLTKPLVGYVPRRSDGLVAINGPSSRDGPSPRDGPSSHDGPSPRNGPSPCDGSTSPDCCTSTDHNGGSLLHNITGTAWPQGDDVIPVMSCRKGKSSGDSSPPNPQLMHIVASSSPHTSRPDLMDQPLHETSHSLTKGLHVSTSSHSLPPRPITSSPPYLEPPDVDTTYLLPPPEEWGGHT